MMAKTVSNLMKINVRARSMEKARAIFVDLLGGELVQVRGGNTIGDVWLAKQLDSRGHLHVRTG